MAIAASRKLCCSSCSSCCCLFEGSVDESESSVSIAADRRIPQPTVESSLIVEQIHTQSASKQALLERTNTYSVQIERVDRRRKRDIYNKLLSETKT
jgi:hypothetical protein